MKWEYYAIEVDAGDAATDRLDDAGRDGWEVYAVTHYQYDPGGRIPFEQKWVHHLKRPLKEDAPNGG